jgi:hypothetical protein
MRLQLHLVPMVPVAILPPESTNCISNFSIVVIIQIIIIINTVGTMVQRTDINKLSVVRVASDEAILSIAESQIETP